MLKLASYNKCCKGAALYILSFIRVFVPAAQNLSSRRQWDLLTARRIYCCPVIYETKSSVLPILVRARGEAPWLLSFRFYHSQLFSPLTLPERRFTCLPAKLDFNCLNAAPDSGGGFCNVEED